MTIPTVAAKAVVLACGALEFFVAGLWLERYGEVHLIAVIAGAIMLYAGAAR